MTPVYLISILVLPLLLAGMLIAFVRLARGPSLPDRVVALDLMGTLGIGFIAAYAVVTGQAVLLDVTIVLAMILFLGTVAFAYYLDRRVRS